MTSGHLPADQFGRAAAAWGPEVFAIRVTQETDEERLLAVIEYERERDGETRTDRIARVNRRLQKVRDD